MSVSADSTIPGLVHRACPLCGRDNAGLAAMVGPAAPWAVKSCADCGLVYLENPVSYESLDGDFAWRKTSRSTKKSRKEARGAVYSLNHRAKWLMRETAKALFGGPKAARLIYRFSPSGKVLDIGCGRGKTLSLLPDRYVPFGIEVEASYADSADKLFRTRGGSVVHGNALKGLASFTDGQFDCLLMQSFLEHESMPREAMAAALRVLKPGGHLVIKVPNYASWARVVMGWHWSGFRFPDHVNYFTPETLRRLVSDAGFEIVDFKPWDHLPVGDTMWMVARRPVTAK